MVPLAPTPAVATPEWGVAMHPSEGVAIAGMRTLLDASSIAAPLALVRAGLA